MNFFPQHSNCFAYSLSVLSSQTTTASLFSQQICLHSKHAMWQSELFSMYCLCGSIDNSHNFACSHARRRNNIKPKGNKVLLLNKNNFHRKADALLNTVQSIVANDMTLIAGKNKAQSKDGPLSSKRSSFIGVSRNGAHWQALITINKRKTYIGSYESEKDAVFAFDLHSMLLLSLTAKTNFSYTKHNIDEMIWNYKCNANNSKTKKLWIIKLIFYCYEVDFVFCFKYWGSNNW